MTGIEFAEPNLRKVKLVRKYQLDGLVFIKGYDRTIGFTFDCSPYPGPGDTQQLMFTLTMEDVGEKSMELDKYFTKIFGESLERKDPLRKLGRLFVVYYIQKEKLNDLLSRIEKAMGEKWEGAFRMLISVHVTVESRG